MANERQLKKITLDALEDKQKKLSSVKLRKAAITLVVLLLAVSGGYYVIRMLSGELAVSRFAVNNMTCPACVITIKEATEKATGVVGADISLASREISVKFYENKSSPDNIEKAIEKAGYPVKLDGLFKPAMVGKDEVIAASVNGRPVLMDDLKTGFDVDMRSPKPGDFSATFFSTIGKEILLQAADKRLVVVQPQEVASEIQNIMERHAMTQEKFNEKINEYFGSPEKFSQIVGQRLGILKLLEETIPEDIQDPSIKKQKTIEVIGNFFKDSDVIIYHRGIREKIHAVSGQDDWKAFWPRMIAADNDLNRLLAQSN